MDVFRTPDERFEGLPGNDFELHYAELDGLRLHYVDEGSGRPTPESKRAAHLLQEDRGDWIAAEIPRFLT